MPRCTLPKLFGIQDWFDRRFLEGCEQHDADYVAQGITRKQADCKMAAYIINRGYFWLGVIAYGYCRLFGWFFWYRRQFKRSK